MEDITTENTTLLIPEYDNPDDARRYFKKIYRQIFDFELFAWYRDHNCWPKNRTYKMFLEWFDIKINSEVFDLLEDEIVKEDF